MTAYTTDVLIMGTGAAGCAAAQVVADLGKSACAIDEHWAPGGQFTGGLGIPDYVGVSANSDTLWGRGRELFKNTIPKMQADGYVAGTAPTGQTPETAGYGNQYGDLPERYTPRGGVYARDLALANARKLIDIEVIGVTKDGGQGKLVTLSNGDTIACKQMISASYSGELGMAAGVSYDIGRSEAVSTYGDPVAGTMYNGGNPKADRLRNAKGDIWSGYQGYPHFAQGEADSGIQGYDYRMTWELDDPDGLPIQPPEFYREEDFKDFIQRAQAYSKYQNMVSGQFIGPKILTTNGNDQFGLPRLYARCRTKADRRAWIKAHYYVMCGQFYTAANSGAVPSAFRTDMHRLKLPHLDNVTEFAFQRGWSSAPYFRETIRMINRRIFQTREMNISYRDVLSSISRGGYHADSHIVNWSVNRGGGSRQDGNIDVDKTYFGLPWEIFLPPAGIISNLIEVGNPAMVRTPFCSYRMETTMTGPAQAAAVACCLGIDLGVPASQVPLSTLLAKLDSMGAKR